MRIRYSLSVLLLLVAIAAVSHSKDFAEVTDGFAERLPLGGQELILNGTATRSYFGFGVYDVGLYLSEQSSDEVLIMENNPEPKRLKILMLRHVPCEKFSAAVRENLDRNLTPEQQQSYAKELESFLNTFQNGLELKEGSEVAIDYLPEEGTVVVVDGQRHTVIPGREFYHLLLRLWIGNPSQSSIKTGLLGQAKP